MRKRTGIAVGTLITLCTLLVAAVPADAKEPIAKQDFRLSKKGSERLVFTLAETGLLTVRAHVKKPATNTPIRLVLEGPDGIPMEKKGPAPLRLRRKLGDPSHRGEWRATVFNVSKIGEVIGQIRVYFEPDAAGEEEEKPPEVEPEQPREPAETPSADAAAPQIVRAVCRDRNRDVAVELDPTHGTGRLLMSSRYVFALKSSRIGPDVIEMRGNGDEPLFLDKSQKAIYFRNGGTATFCRVDFD